METRGLGMPRIWPSRQRRSIVMSRRCWTRRPSRAARASAAARASGLLQRRFSGKNRQGRRCPSSGPAGKPFAIAPGVRCSKSQAIGFSSAARTTPHP